MPDWYLDCPTLLHMEDWFLNAFWELDSERALGGSTIGKIPWSAVMRYAAFHDLRGLMVERFWTYISTMDRGYLGWQKDEHSRYTRLNEKKNKAAQQQAQKKKGGFGSIFRKRG